MFEQYIANELQQYYDTIQNSKLKDIIIYSLEGGKCIRGFIVKHIIETLTNNSSPWQPIASIELIHGISLILDDLPCMDNDIMRRGKPSTFARFGERHSILVSMYGISEAFKILFNGLKNVNNNIYNIESIEMIINKWSEFIGNNLVVGQMMDFRDNIGELLNIDIPSNNTNLIYYKTSSLFVFAFILGAIYSGINNLGNSKIDDFQNMGLHLGMMYQIMDDSNDVENDNINNNIILSHGKEKCKEMYSKAQYELVELLLKYNLMTPMFEKLINIITNKLNL
jgi:geranylgeranyl diphosphate synthase type II